MSSQKTIWDEFKDRDFAYAYFDEFLNTFIATQVKILREQRGFRQEKLAQLSGMKQERISVLENVNYTSWSVNTLRRIARALGVRLRISFETFSSGLPEMRTFNAENLARKSLDDELEEYGAAPVVSKSMAEAAAPSPSMKKELRRAAYEAAQQTRDQSYEGDLSVPFGARLQANRASMEARP